MRKIISTTKVVLSALLLIPILLLVGCPSSCGETAQIQKNMTEGLKKIYGKEFVVSRPHMTGNPGFGYHYEAKAHPKDNPAIKFTVAYDVNQKGDYGENYLEMLWSYQGEQELNEILKKQYGDSFYIYTYWFRYYNKDFKSLSHSEVIKKCDGWAHIWIEYYVFSDNKIDKISEAEKIYNVMQNFFLKYHIKKYRIIVGYTSKYYETNKFFEIEIKNSSKTMDELIKEGKLTNYLDIEHLAMNDNEIKSVQIDDIISVFK